MRSPDDVRRDLLAERDATIRLFEAAQANLAVVEPQSLREPLRWFFAAKVQQCRAHSSILGLPLNYAIQMAEAVTAQR